MTLSIPIPRNALISSANEIKFWLSHQCGSYLCRSVINQHIGIRDEFEYAAFIIALLVVEFYRFSKWYPCNITYITCNFNFSRPSVITTNANQNESYLLQHSLGFLLWISKLTGDIFCRFYDSCCQIFGSWLLWSLCYFHPSKLFHHWSIHKNLPRNISSKFELASTITTLCGCLHTYQNIETDIRKKYENSQQI